MLFIYNRKEFLTESFGKEKFVSFSKIDWITPNIQVPHLMPYNIVSSLLETKDDPMPFGKSNSEEFYNLEPIPSVPFYENPLLIGGILIQMSFD